MRYEKVYVETVVRFLSNGGMRPKEIVWVDGKKYQIDRVKFIDRAPSKVGTLTTRRFTVVIGGVEKYLFFEEHSERWFVEKNVENDFTQRP